MSISGIKTPEQFSEYLKTVSQNARLVMPTSSNYFVEQAGDVKIFNGLQSFDQVISCFKILSTIHAQTSTNVSLWRDSLPVCTSQTVELGSQELDPRVDVLAFTMLAWVQMSKGKLVKVVEKQLYDGEASAGQLVCWSWAVGGTGDTFTFGAHDFSGLDLVDVYSEAQQVVIKSPRGDAADGDLHLVAVVVTQTDISFFMDANLLSAQKLPRPVTDCKRGKLRVGNEGIPTLGEIIFSPREVTKSEMLEMMSWGFTLQSISSGRLPFNPQQTRLDDLVLEQKTRFEESQKLMKSINYDVILEGTHIRVGLESYREEDKMAALSSDASEIALSVAPTPNCQTASFTGKTNPMPCNIIQEALEENNGTLKYYEMFPPSLRSSRPAKDRYRFDPTNKQWLSYNVTKFPSWCGKSVSFSLWLDRFNGQAKIYESLAYCEFFLEITRELTF